MLASPVLVGAVTTLVVIVAVFLAYNANNGLPFVPTREVEVMAANGSNLTPGNDVREGGFRVGTLDSLRPVLLPDGTVGALLKLKLDRTSGPLPVDSQAVIRSRSALGLKYVQIVRGSARRTLPDGGIIPLSQTTVPVQFDEIYKTFDRSTRQSSQQNLVVFGDAFAGRGGALNQTIEQLPVLLGYLESVSRNLNDPRTGLANFFTQLDRAAQTLAPIVATQVAAFRDAAVTFDAIVRDPASFQSTIDKSPATLDAGTDSLITTRPFLADLTGFGHDLQTATRQLSPTLPEINLALETAPGPLRRSVALNGQLPLHVVLPTRAGLRPQHEPGPARADRHRQHPQPAVALLRPLHHGLQLAEHVGHLRPRALLRVRPDGLLAAGAAQLRRRVPQQRRQPGRHRSGHSL